MRPIALCLRIGAVEWGTLAEGLLGLGDVRGEFGNWVCGVGDAVVPGVGAGADEGGGVDVVGGCVVADAGLAVGVLLMRCLVMLTACG